MFILNKLRKKPFDGLESEHPVFGYMAEFEEIDEVVEAVKKVKAEGYADMEAYSPMPSHELNHALGHKSRLANLVFCGGATGATAGFCMQAFSNVFHYPINIGGRPDFSWPSFIIITFEMTILFSALTAVFGMILLNGLPRPHHPVFSVPQFERASQDRFFLVVHSADPKFDMTKTKATLDGLAGAVSVAEVPKG